MGMITPNSVVANSEDDGAAFFLDAYAVNHISIINSHS
jgi:hypothetical protein